MDEGEPDEEGESSDEAANEKDHVDKQPRNKKPPGWKNIRFYHLILSIEDLLFFIDP